MVEKKDEGIVIRLKNISKIYQMSETVKVKAVDGVSITIKRGEFVAIMGPSGSGKSTCMNMVGSLDIPTLGTIFLDEEDISKFEESELAQMRGKKIGFVFQSFNLVPNLTTIGNVTLPMIFQGIDKEERTERAKGLLRKVGLKDRMNNYPNQLSGGERQRVAIARALANDPEVILADEPTGNLDTKTGEMVMDFLSKLNDEGKTIIMVTHDPRLAQKHADIVYWLRDGKLEKITKKKRLQMNPVKRGI
jgi:putative ABC transport system ATP-binding protein